MLFGKKKTSDWCLAVSCVDVVVVHQDVEKELELQISMKQEMEMALQLLEKDIHEKQDNIVTLRQQLDEIKAINLEMYNKLQVG